MNHQTIFGSALLACAGLFSTAAMAADECGPLKLATSVKLIDVQNRELIPVTINGVSKILLLDTGGYMSQLSRKTVEEMKIPAYDGAIQLADVSGNVSRKYVIIDTLTLGTLTAQKQPMMVSPGDWLDADGILSSDLLLRYDVEMDFPGRKIKYFLPDHCKGKVIYWHPDAVAAVPITIVDKSRLMVPVKLDGQEFNALIDTGATRTTITTRTAKSVFGLEPGSPGMTPNGNVNGDPKLTSFTHVFPTLTFQDITVTNPKVGIMPDRIADADHTQQTGNRALTNGAFYKIPDLILGMDILRHLRIYMAFGEKTLYVTPGAPVPEATSKTAILAKLDEGLSAAPNNPALLNYRCFERGLTRNNLDGALADCELSLKLRPGDSNTIDSKGFILYQLGRYEDAVDTYNQVLKHSPQKAPSLFIRGLAKQKLGDAAGGAVDIAAAKAIDSNVKMTFDGAGIAEN
jgi:hypothetical protein